VCVSSQAQPHLIPPPFMGEDTGGGAGITLSDEPCRKQKLTNSEALLTQD
jgi:hypothetical protein